MTTAFYLPAACLEHDMGAHHPECPDRLRAIADLMRSSGLMDQVLGCEAAAAQVRDLQGAHAVPYVDDMLARMARAQAQSRTDAVDPDTFISPGTWAAALQAAGAAIHATDAVIDGRVNNAFCAVRPPGHHACHDRAMGFCFFNHVAMAARHALDVRGLQRVAIIDFDVHHGNGTEDIVAHDERILMCSFFQHPFYPYSGEHPTGPQLVNVPVDPYTRGPAIRQLISRHWAPALEAFAPELIVVSAGFDAHREDTLGQLGLEEDDYAWITQQIVRWAQRHAQGRIVSCLEGGYHLSALARSVCAHVRVLAGVTS